MARDVDFKVNVSHADSCEMGHPLLPNGLHLKQEDEAPHKGVTSITAGLKRHQYDLDNAKKYMEACGLIPTLDAQEQLASVFQKCLRIMCERDYDPNGLQWMGTGWRGVLWDVHKKFKRMWYRGWKKGQYFEDDPIDMINFLAFYVRLACTGEPWGDAGEPGDSKNK